MKRVALVCLAIMMMCSDSIGDQDFDEFRKKIITHNAQVYATVRQATRRCKGVRLLRSGLEGLRNIYDPGWEIAHFDREASKVDQAWDAAATPEVLHKLCSRALVDYGSVENKWIGD